MKDSFGGRLLQTSYGRHYTPPDDLAKLWVYYSLSKELQGAAIAMHSTLRMALFLSVLLVLSPSLQSQSKVKLKGYVTERPGDEVVQILDDHVAISGSTRFEPEGRKPADLAVGMLIEAEGTWSAKHRFKAQKVTIGESLLEKEIRGSAFLAVDPEKTNPPPADEKLPLKVDGELLLAAASVKFQGRPQARPETAGPSRLLGSQLRYVGTRQSDGSILLRELEFAPPPPADAYEIGGGRKVTRGQDEQTGTDLLEIRKQNKVEGRMKLFDVRPTQEYVASLGRDLLPDLSTYPLPPGVEFRFFVVEDASVNATALPDGVILINTGLLGLVENEAQLAFVLSHEIAHVLEAHHWRQVTETRTKRILLTVAAYAGSAYIGNTALFLGQLGMAALMNGFERKIENQADRLALQNIIDRGYDPAPALRFFHIMVDRYADRSTSALWSNHDSSTLRGSYLTIQVQRRFPGQPFREAKTDTPAFRAAREAMGPVKIQ